MAHNSPLEWNRQWVAPLISSALAEDLGERGDVTSQLLIPEAAEATLTFRNRQPLTVAGLDIIAATFEAVNAHCGIKLHANDGDQLPAMSVMATLSGHARELLTGERVALNLLQRACAVATETQAYVQAIAGTGCKIRDTRKTMPGMRMLDKYAVRCGGGENHRIGLFDMIMIKDNHIAICGGIHAAIDRAIEQNTNKLPIEVECDTLAQVEEALRAPIDWILLDNMTPDMLHEAVRLRGDKPIKLEASGGITLATARQMAETGVDAISVGAITHSAPAVDIGLDIEMHLIL